MGWKMIFRTSRGPVFSGSMLIFLGVSFCFKYLSTLPETNSKMAPESPSRRTSSKSPRRYLEVVTWGNVCDGMALEWGTPEWRLKLDHFESFCWITWARKSCWITWGVMYCTWILRFCALKLIRRSNLVILFTN